MVDNLCLIQDGVYTSEDLDGIETEKQCIQVDSILLPHRAIPTIVKVILEDNRKICIITKEYLLGNDN